MDTITTAAAPENDAERPRDRRFTPYRYATSDRARSVVVEVIRAIEQHEAKVNARQRRRRADDQRTFEATVEAVVCDLIHRARSEHGGWLSVSLSNRFLGRAHRYSPPVFSKTFPALLGAMAQIGILELEKGHQGPFGEPRLSTMRAGSALLQRVNSAGLELEDLGRRSGEEVIILKKARAEADEDRDEWVDYVETETTRRFRKEMERINESLARAEIACDAALGPDARVVDDSDRLLRRYFNGSFGEGGRLFGGFWMQMKKRDRRDEILIEGCPVVSLDYSQMAPKLLYAHAGLTPPTDDAYTLPGLEYYRDGVKKVFNSLLFATKPLKRMPQGVRKVFDRRISVAKVVDLITERHRAVADLFCKGIGLRLMFKESCILVAALLELIERGVVALPVHDAVVVSGRDQEVTRAVMLDVFKRLSGVEGKVELERG